MESTTTTLPTQHKIATGLAQQRAKTLHKKTVKRNKDRVESTKRELFSQLEKRYGANFERVKNQNMGTLWREFVMDRNDAEAFMAVMYPHFDKVVQLAYVDMFERSVAGEIQLPDNYLFNKDEEEQKGKDKWDPIKDIEEQNLEAQQRLAIQRIQDLLIEEEKTKKTVTTVN